MDTPQSKNRLLLVDGDPKSLRVLDVSLKKSGFEVMTATSGREALKLLEATRPDLIISDTDLEEIDGFELCSQIKVRPEWAKIPFIFVSGRKSIEDKIRGLELGVDDYLTKPIYIKEIGIRVRTALQRTERERMESRREGRTRFAGDLSDVGVVDLVQTIELNRKSGIIHIVNRAGHRGSIFFRDGKVIDAEVGRLSGTNAIYRLFTWSEGQFAVEFKQIRRHDVIDTSIAPLLMEGMRRLDESTHLLEKLPSPGSILEVDCRVLAEELAELPDEMDSVLRLCDGARTLQEVIEDSDIPDLEALNTIDRLFAGKIIFGREAPDRGGESEPSERLARWLSEGDAEDGSAAEEDAKSVHGAMSLPFDADSDDVPSVTPAPAILEPQLSKTENSHQISAPTSTSEEIIPQRQAGVASVKPSPPTPLPDPISPENPQEATTTGTSADAQERVLSAKKSLVATLSPSVAAMAEGSDEFAKPEETLKGRLFDKPLSDQETKTAGQRTDRPEKANIPATVPTTKPLGLAARLLSEDSALGASAMLEALSRDGEKVIGSQSSEGQSPECGNPDAAAAAALVHEVVLSSREIALESSPQTEPARPTKEVDWGSWSTSAAASALADEQTPVILDNSPIHDGQAVPPDENPLSSKSDVPLSTSSERQPIPEVDPPRAVAEPPPLLMAESRGQHAIEEDTKTPQSASPTPADGKADAPSASARAEPSKAAAIGLAPPPPSTELTPAGSNPHRSTSARQLRLLAIGLVVAGTIAFIGLRKRSIPPGDSLAPAATSSPALTSPLPIQPVPPWSGTAAVSTPATAQNGDPVNGALSPSAAAELSQKCLGTDDDGKGKVKAVWVACRPALDADPNNVDVMLILARTNIDRGHVLEARALAKKAISTDPQRFEAYVVLGTAEQEAGRIDEARAAYKKYLELAPDGPFARQLRAILRNL